MVLQCVLFMYYIAWLPVHNPRWYTAVSLLISFPQSYSHSHKTHVIIILLHDLFFFLPKLFKSVIKCRASLLV